MSEVKHIARLKTDDLSWFDIGKYDRTKSWGVPDWTRHLGVRYMLKGVADRGHCVGKSPNDSLNEILVKILCNPTPNEGGHVGGFLAKGSSRVWDRTVVDVYDGQFRLKNEAYQDVDSAAKAWYHHIDVTGEVPEIPALLDRAFIDLIYERFPDSSYYEEVFVDLNTSDAQLIGDFKNWLAKKREARGIGAPKKDVTDADMQDWWRYRVLALIDIDLFCHYTDTSISQATLGNLLFPDEFDIDVSERVRKVVRPLANKLMSNVYLAALDEQAARVERKTE